MSMIAVMGEPFVSEAAGQRQTRPKLAEALSTDLDTGKPMHGDAKDRADEFVGAFVASIG